MRSHNAHPAPARIEFSVAPALAELVCTQAFALACSNRCSDYWITQADRPKEGIEH